MAKRDTDILQELRERILPSDGGLNEILEGPLTRSNQRKNGRGGLDRIITLAAGALSVWELMRGRSDNAEPEEEPERRAAPSAKSRSSAMREQVERMRKR
jgi:hypothetical protein